MRTVPVETDRPSVRPNKWVYAYTSDHGVTPLGGAYPATQQLVVDLMTSWGADLYLFGGDNAYNSGTAGEVTSAWAPWADEIDDEKVFAVLGNHDLDTTDGSPTTSFFTYWPGNERYYIVERGPVAFVMINSGYNTAGAIVEKDGVGEDSTQWRTLADQLTRTSAKFKVAILHHSPYTSASNYTPGKTAWRLPWSEYGIDLVLSGHSHNYERLLVDEVPHIVAGIGGASLVGFSTPLSQSVVRKNTFYGALKITAFDDSLHVSLRDTNDDEQDFLKIIKPFHPKR